MSEMEKCDQCGQVLTEAPHICKYRDIKLEGHSIRREAYDGEYCDTHKLYATDCFEREIASLRDRLAKAEKAAIKGAELALALRGCPLKEPYRDKVIVATVELKEAMKAMNQEVANEIR